MPVPNSMADLATLAGSNSPAGSEAIGNSLDNYLRAHAAIIRSTNAVASASIAAASTTDIGSADGESVQVTGAATITSLGTGYAGCVREVRFSGACVLTHSGNLVLPGGVNLTTAAFDVITFRCIASGQWTLVSLADGRGVLKTGDTMSGNLAISNSQNAVTGLTISNFTDGASASARVQFSAPGGAPYAYIGVNPSLNPDFPDSVAFGSIIAKPVNLFQGNVSRLRLNTSAEIEALARLRKSAFSAQFPTFRGDFVIEGGGGAVGTAGGLEFMSSNFGAGYGWRVAAPDSSGVNLRFQTRQNSATWTEVGTWTPTDLSMTTSLTLGGGKKLSKVTVSNSAPGALADGELYLRY